MKGVTTMKRKMNKNLAWTLAAAILLSMLSFTGCFLAYGIQFREALDAAIRQHSEVMSQIHLGDSTEKVVGLLEPIQQEIHPTARKLSERFMKDGVEVYIYYARSGRIPDDLTTDDEFTPYIFNNGKLTAVGWTTLGGPKTHGQVPPQINVNVQQKVQ
jgi:hypothetical protein